MPTMTRREALAGGAVMVVASREQAQPAPSTTGRVVSKGRLKQSVCRWCFNDMSVVIRSPVSGLGTGLHFPWFRYGYPQFALATRDALTDRGRREAKWMLKELYDYSQDDGRDGVSRVWTGTGGGAKSPAIFECWTQRAWRIQSV